MKRFLLAFLPLSLILCASPASITSASSPSPSPAARELSDMSVAYANPDELNLRKYFKYSVFFHIACVAAILIASFFDRHGAGSRGVGGTLDGAKVTPLRS